MPRTPKLIPAGIRLSDKIALGHFHRCFPQDIVRGALADCQRTTQRHRELPNDVVVYFVMALAIFREVSQPEVLRCVAEGLQWLHGLNELKITGRSGISQARTRVGFEPLMQVFRQCAKPLAKPKSTGCFYRDWHLFALDGTTFDVEDCQENDLYFDRPKNQKSDGAYPQARMVGIVECGTHAVIDAAVGTYRDSELKLALDVLSKIQAGSLYLADRFFMSYDMFKAVTERKGDVLFRSRTDRTLPAEDVLSDGSYLSTIYRHDDGKHANPIRVRVVEYEVKGAQGPTWYRLITSILDETRAPAAELAALYRERWEFETVLDELKTHLNGHTSVLRSKTPDLVKQEIYGLLMAHYAIRTLMYEAAYSAELDPDQLSFTHSVRVIRRKMPSFGIFPPSEVIGTNDDRDSPSPCVI